MGGRGADGAFVNHRAGGALRDAGACRVWRRCAGRSAGSAVIIRAKGASCGRGHERFLPPASDCFDALSGSVRSADWLLAGPGASATVSPSFAFLWSGRHLQSRLHRHRCKLNTAKPPAGRRPMPGLVSVWNMVSPACRVRLPRLRPDSGGVGEEEASQDRGSRSTSQGGREVLRPRHHLDAATAADDTIFRFQNKVTNGRPRTTSE